jgi:uncharacterized protein with PIN domain
MDPGRGPPPRPTRRLEVPEALSVASPELAAAMVSAEVQRRCQTEELLREEARRCAELRAEIARLKSASPPAPAPSAAAATLSPTSRCPVCKALVPRAEKASHASQCLSRLVTFCEQQRAASTAT